MDDYKEYKRNKVAIIIWYLIMFVIVMVVTSFFDTLTFEIIALSFLISSLQPLLIILWIWYVEKESKIKNV